MPKLKIHYEGWVALPAAFRRRLGLESGAELEAELVAGTIILRPTKRATKAVEEGAAPEVAVTVPAPSVLAAEAQEPEQPAAVPKAPVAPRRHGRQAKSKG